PDVAPEPARRRPGNLPAKAGHPDRPAAPPLAAGDVVGVDRRLAERLRRGRLPIESTLDLHGLTQDEAHASLDRFITMAVAKGIRTVLVVTGKGRGDGGGVLKATLPRWLNTPGLRRHLLAFAMARPEHGGTGAVYILLRRSKRR